MMRRRGYPSLGHSTRPRPHRPPRPHSNSPTIRSSTTFPSFLVLALSLLSLAVLPIAGAGADPSVASVSGDPCGLLHTAPCPLPSAPSGDDVDPEEAKNDAELMESKQRALEQLRVQLEEKRKALEEQIAAGGPLVDNAEAQRSLAVLRSTDTHVQQAAGLAKRILAWGPKESQEEVASMAGISDRIRGARASMETQLRETEEREFARESEDLVGNLGLQAQARVNRQMAIMTKDLSGDLHKLEVGMESRFLKGMKHSFERLRSVVVEEVGSEAGVASKAARAGLEARIDMSMGLLLKRKLDEAARDLGRSFNSTLRVAVARAVQSGRISHARVKSILKKSRPTPDQEAGKKAAATGTGMVPGGLPGGGEATQVRDGLNYFGGDDDDDSGGDKKSVAAAVAEAAKATEMLKNAGGDPVKLALATRAIQAASAHTGAAVNATGHPHNHSHNASRHHNHSHGDHGLMVHAKDDVAVELDAMGHPMFRYGPTAPLGPANWGRISADYATCGSGKRQSPINIQVAPNPKRPQNVVVNPRIPSLAVQIPAFAPARMMNDGHSVVVDFPADLDGECEYGTRQFVFKQFHVHAPGEHRVNGHMGALVVHMVFAAAGGGEGKLVIEASFEVKPRGGGFLDMLVDNLPAKPVFGDTAPQLANSSHKLDLEDGIFDGKGTRVIVPASEFYTYNGSLTTPPCSEVVEWFVLKKTLPVTEGQLKRLVRVLPKPGNARPVQNKRWATPPVVLTGALTSREVRGVLHPKPPAPTSDVPVGGETREDFDIANNGNSGSGSGSGSGGAISRGSSGIGHSGSNSSSKSLRGPGAVGAPLLSAPANATGGGGGGAVAAGISGPAGKSSPGGGDDFVYPNVTSSVSSANASGSASGSGSSSSSSSSPGASGEAGDEEESPEVAATSKALKSMPPGSMPEAEKAALMKSLEKVEQVAKSARKRGEMNPTKMEKEQQDDDQAAQQLLENVKNKIKERSETAEGQVLSKAEEDKAAVPKKTNNFEERQQKEVARDAKKQKANKKMKETNAKGTKKKKSASSASVSGSGSSLEGSDLIDPADDEEEGAKKKEEEKKKKEDAKATAAAIEVIKASGQKLPENVNQQDLAARQAAAATANVAPEDPKATAAMGRFQSSSNAAFKNIENVMKGGAIPIPGVSSNVMKAAMAHTGAKPAAPGAAATLGTDLQHMLDDASVVSGGKMQESQAGRDTMSQLKSLIGTFKGGATAGSAGGSGSAVAAAVAAAAAASPAVAPPPAAPPPAVSQPAPQSLSGAAAAGGAVPANLGGAAAVEPPGAAGAAGAGAGMMQAGALANFGLGVGGAPPLAGQGNGGGSAGTSESNAALSNAANMAVANGAARGDVQSFLSGLGGGGAPADASPQVQSALASLQGGAAAGGGGGLGGLTQMLRAGGGAGNAGGAGMAASLASLPPL